MEENPEYISKVEEDVALRIELQELGYPVEMSMNNSEIAKVILEKEIENNNNPVIKTAKRTAINYEYGMYDLKNSFPKIHRAIIEQRLKNKEKDNDSKTS